MGRNKLCLLNKRILNQHALGIPGDQLRSCEALIVGEETGRLVVAQDFDEELSGLLLVDAWCAAFAVRHIEGHSAPGGWRQVLDLLEQGRRAPSRNVMKMIPCSSSRSSPSKVVSLES